MKEDIRIDLTKRLENFKHDHWYEDVEMLDQLIWEMTTLNHTLDCSHEYALRSADSRNGKLKCMCLDCGQLVREQDCQNLIEVDKKHANSMNSIRFEYLDSLRSKDSEHAMAELSGKCGGIRLTLTKKETR